MMNHDFKYIVDNCKVCGGKGYVFKREIQDGSLHNTSTQCTCIGQMFIRQKFQQANIPLEYYDLSFEKDFVVKNNQEYKLISSNISKAIGDIDGYYRSGQCLYLYGNQGTGKTMAAVEILKAACLKGYSIHYDWFPNAIETFSKKGYKADDEKRAYELMLERTDFFVFDELGKETDNSNYNKSDILKFLEINVLKKRSNKITIFISNFEDGLDGIPTRYSPSIKSIMSQKFFPLHFKAKDFRNTAIGKKNGFFVDGVE